MKNYLLFIFLAVLLCFAVFPQRQEAQGMCGTEANADENKHRVIVLAEERIGDKEPYILTTEGVIISAFDKAGYLIVEPGRARALLNVNHDELIDAARTLSADVIVFCKAYGTVLDKHKINGINLFMTRSTVQLKTMLVESAYNLVSHEIVEKKTSGLTEEDGVIKGFKEAAKEVAERIVSKLALDLDKNSKTEDEKITQEPKFRPSPESLPKEKTIAVLVNGESEHHNATVAAIVCLHLDEKGYKLIDEKGLAAFRKANRELLSSDIRVTNSVGAIITLSAQAGSPVINQFGIYTGTASIAVMVTTPGGKIIYSDVVQGKQLGGIPDEAAQKAVEEAALRAVERCVEFGIRN